MQTDEYFMGEAIKLALLAKDADEVPVGALVVRDGEIISTAYNTREASKCATHHAEILAIEGACRALGGWRLPGCEMYVTMEPCPMCAGAIINARIVSVYYGAYDKKAGAFGTLFDMNTFGLNHKPEIFSGLMEKECSELLSSFFSELRERRKRKKTEESLENNAK